MCVWNSEIPFYQIPNYIIPTVQSIYRVSIGIGLILTHEVGMTFKSAHGYDSYIHMLATATAAQITLIFSQTNINSSMWTGFNNSRDDVFSTQTQQRAISMATNHIARYTPLRAMLNSWYQWDQDVIYEYFGIDPFTDINWLSYSPLPHHYVQQWSKKINYITGESTSESTYLRHNGSNHMCLMLTQKTLQYRSLMSATIDADRYFPLVSVREPDAALQHLVAWVDQ